MLPISISEFTYTNVGIPEAIRTYSHHLCAYFPQLSRIWVNLNSKAERMLAEIGQDPAKFVAALVGPNYYILQRGLKIQFALFTADQKDTIIRQTLAHSIETGDPSLYKRSLNLLDLKQMKELLSHVQNKAVEVKDLIEKHLMLDSLRHENDNPSVLKNEITNGLPLLGHFFHSVVGTFLAAAQIFELGYEPDSAFDASYQMTVYFQVISIPLALFNVITLFLQNTWISAAAFGATIITMLAALRVYLLYYQPAPVKLPYGAVNLTQEVRLGWKRPIVGRSVELDQLVAQLAGNATEEARKHAFIKGITGVGKTELISGLAYRIAKAEVPEVLKNKEVFLFDTSKLIGSPTYQGLTRLENVRKKIGKHANKMVIVMDEIQLAKEDKALWGGLLKLLGTGSEGVPFFIAITSDEKFKDLFAEDLDLRGRFMDEPIDLQETKPEQTKEILKFMLSREAPEFDASPTFFDDLIGQAKESSGPSLEPKKSKNLLAQLIGKYKAQFEGEELCKNIREQEAKIKNLELDLKAQKIEGSRLISPEVNRLVEDLRATRVALEQFKKDLVVFKKAVATFKSYRQQRKVRENRLSEIAKRVNRKEADDLHYLFELFYGFPALDQAAAKVAEAHGIKTVLITA